ncbi:MAG: NfeD family protein [Chloroflexota bacterium]
MPVDLTLLDPNLIYLLLFVGLWVGVTAVYVPGTFIPELISTVLIIGSLFVLASVTTAWWAVAILFIGIAAFLLLPFFGEKYGRFAELGLVGQGIGSFFLFPDQTVSPFLIGATLIIALAYHRLILLPTLKNQRRFNEYDESNEVLGVRGRVVKDLDPVGTVYVNKELWRARSPVHLTRDTPIMVVGQQGLELQVEKAKNEDIPIYDEYVQEDIKYQSKEN